MSADPTRSPVVVDTNVVSFILRDHELARLYEPLLKGRQAMISAAVVGEIRRGALFARWSRARLRRVERDLRRFHVLDITERVALEWAAINYERRSEMLSPMDAWHAATARAAGVPLITHDKRFKGTRGLKVICKA